jgi:phosphate/sulfate permease
MTIVLISLCLGIGTMIGWKRVVKTIGEKIGKTPFDYSQGFISQVVSALTIFASTYFKLPVSTTHIVSSSVMGTMFAKGGKGNIQRKTITNIFMAWVLTLPVSIGLSAGIFWLLRFLLV